MSWQASRWKPEQATAGQLLSPPKEQVRVQGLAEPQLAWKLEQGSTGPWPPSPEELIQVQGMAGPQLPWEQEHRKAEEQAQQRQSGDGVSVAFSGKWEVANWAANPQKDQAVMRKQRVCEVQNVADP